MAQSAAFEKAYQDIISRDADGSIRTEALRLVRELDWVTVKAWNVTKVLASSPEFSACIYLGAGTLSELFERYVVVDVYYPLMRLAREIAGG